ALQGAVSFIEPPADLTAWTQQARENCPYTPASLRNEPRPSGSVLPPIKHVLYIIKENRTYDQVFGDMPKGNGDPKICMFREEISFKCYGEGAKDVPMENRGSVPGARDPQRVDGIIKDLHAAEEGGDLPAFMIMSLGEDHTHGTTPGEFTPSACVASNDQAI